MRLETRPPNVEGKGAVRQRQLLINALRMRPDRIIVGEVRGEEALDMLQAMNTGHDGSLTTVHANTPRDALSRIETMIAMANLNLPEKAMRQQIASAIQIVVQQTRMSDGTRKVTSISEITGMEGDVITMQEIFLFEKLGLGPNGKVLGRFYATGIVPKFAEKLQSAGMSLDTNLLNFSEEICGRHVSDWFDLRGVVLLTFAVIFAGDSSDGVERTIEGRIAKLKNASDGDSARAKRDRG